MIIDLSSAAVLRLVDIPPSKGTERHFIKNLLIVVAASLLCSTRRLRHRVLSMRLLFVSQRGSSSPLTC